MKNKNEEVPLDGGNVNMVVKVGNTVRRQQSPNSKTIHKYLAHLKNKQIAAPQFLGIDDDGREVLSFIEGETEFPPDLWTNTAHLQRMGKLLKDLHEASIDFLAPPETEWAFSYPDKSKHEVINHNDFAPYNMVFRADGSVAIIDFDLIGPGPRSRDLAYLAYWMAPLSFGPNPLIKAPLPDLETKCGRVRRLCSAYGFTQPHELVPMVQEVLNHRSNESAAFQRDLCT